jgi:TolB protein
MKTLNHLLKARPSFDLPRTLALLIAIVGLALPMSVWAAPAAPAAPVAPALADYEPEQTLYEVNIEGDVFMPATITITVGSVLRWRNLDAHAHTTTSDDGYWNWGLFPGASYSLRFLSPGTYAYHCLYHAASMAGEVVVVEGSSATAVAPSPTPGPTGEPDLDGIVYDYPVDDALGGETELFVIGADGGGKTRLTDSPDRAEVQPNWSPDRREIAFAGRDGTSAAWGIWVLDRATGQSRQLSTGPEHYEPDWRPDGSLIAFTDIERAGGIIIQSQISVIRPDGTGYRPVVRVQDRYHSVGNASWSPDGTMLAFTLSSEASGGELYLFDYATSQVKRLFSHPGWDDIDPAWSPNGRLIAFAAGVHRGSATRHDIWVVDVESGVAGTVARHPEFELRQPAWSPDGSRLVFTARFQNAPARWGLYLVPARGGDVTGPIALGVEPDWSSELQMPFPTPEVQPFTPEPLPTFPPPEPTEPGPTATDPAPPTFPPSGSSTPEFTPTAMHTPLPPTATGTVRPGAVHIVHLPYLINETQPQAVASPAARNR